MGNPIIKQFKMRRNGGEASRASEVSLNSYSMNQERTMANMGMIDSGMNMGTPMNYGTPPLNTGKPKKKSDDDFDYTPSTPGAGVTGTMVTETVGAGTGKSVYEKGKKGGGFEAKKAGDKLAGGGKVLESKKVGSKGRIKQKVRKVKFS